MYDYTAGCASTRASPTEPGIFFTCPVASSIRDHSMECDAPFTIDHFKIIDREHSSYNLRILESMYICKTKPSINDKNSAFKLSIVS